jgi:chromosome segregation ATPase
MKFRFYSAIPVLITALALPAVAQFEVSPDHFEDSIAEDPPIANAGSHKEIEKHLATDQARLTGYQEQIKTQVALVEAARKQLNSLVERTEKAAARIALQARQRDLEALRSSLAWPIRYAKASIAALKTERRTVATAELRPMMQ